MVQPKRENDNVYLAVNMISKQVTCHVNISSLVINQLKTCSFIDALKNKLKKERNGFIIDNVKRKMMRLKKMFLRK